MGGNRQPRLRAAAARPGHLVWLFSRNRAPPSPCRQSSHSFDENGGGVPPLSAATELFVLFCRKMGGGFPCHFPTAQDDAVRPAAEQSFSTRSRREPVRDKEYRTHRAQTGGGNGSPVRPGLCLRMETAALVMRRSVRPESQWGTDLFSPLISHAFLPVRWRMAVDAAD